MIDLRLGRWQDVLADVGEVDALITDPPYGRRTHEGQMQGIDGADRLAIDYSAWTAEDVLEFVISWSPRVRGWMACLTSHDLVEAYRLAFQVCGRYAFAPVPCVTPGMTVRLQGDGPSSWAVYLAVARPRRAEFLGWGALPGAYVIKGGDRKGNGGGGRGKPAQLCEALVRDYSRPGSLIVDPCVGWGHILTAAERLGRNSIGSEVDPDVYAKASGVVGSAHQLALV